MPRQPRTPGRWVDVDPLLVAAVRRGRSTPPRDTDGLVAPAARPHAGRARLRPRLRRCSPTTAPRSRPPPRPPARWRAIGLARRRASGSRPAPRSTSAPPARPGPPTCVARGPRRRARRPARWSASAATSRVAAPDGEPWPVAVSERPARTRRHALVHLTAAAWPPRAPGSAAGAAAARARHHLLDPRTGRPAREVWRTRHRDGPHLRGGQHRQPRPRSCSATTPRPGSRRTASRARLVAADGARPPRPAAWPAPDASERHERMTDGPLLWYLNRGTGLVLLVLLTAGRGPRRARDRRPAGARRAALRHPGPAPQPRRCSSVALLVAHVAHRGRRHLRRHPLVAGGRAVRGATYQPLWLGPRQPSPSTCSSSSCATSLLRARMGHRSWRRGAPAGVRRLGRRGRARPRHRHRPARRSTGLAGGTWRRRARASAAPAVVAAAALRRLAGRCACAAVRSS